MLWNRIESTQRQLHPCPAGAGRGSGSSAQHCSSSLGPWQQGWDTDGGKCSALQCTPSKACQQEPNLAAFVTKSIQSSPILRVNCLGTGHFSGKIGTSTQAAAPFLALSNYFPSDKRMIKFCLCISNPSVFAAEDCV